MLAVALLLVQAQEPVFDGHLRQLDVRVPRIEATVHIDGVLDEDVWRQAALLTGFSQYRPVDSRPAEDSTQVLVFYAPDAIYFGIRAFEKHGNVVRATLADRDNIGADDNIQILLDTFNDRRRALLFAVNPLGAQQDGVRSEGIAGAASGGNAGGRFDGVVDLNPDYVYESQGRVTPSGFEVEVRIPFKSLRYQSAAVQDWGIQIGRVTVNERFAVFFPEKRPFFLEGLEQFDTPNALIYTRRISAPVGGAKLTGKIGGTGVAYIGAIDDNNLSATGDHPIVNLLRLRRDLGTSSAVGL